MTPATVPAVPVPPDLERKLRRAVAKEKRLARQHQEEGVDARDQIIVECVRAGASLREVGAVVGITHAGVADIVRRKGGGQ